MARVASLGEVCRDVIRVGRALVILQVAGDACRAVQGVVVIDVAVGALPRRHHVQSGERESRSGVIKLAVHPQHRIVALLARCGETRMRHRRGRVVVVGLVATDARRAGDAVVVVHVAVSALPRRYHVRSRQRESRLRVVKRCRLPCRGVVTGFTRLRKATGNVVRVRRTIEILQVTRDARDAGQVVVVIDVAIRALSRRHRVRSGQSEVDHRVIESRRGPGNRGMALLAGRGKICRDVIGVRGALEILQVTANAGHAGDVVVIVDVAVDALPRWHSVPSRQRKSDRSVIELRIQPVVGSVAGVTSS